MKRKFLEYLLGWIFALLLGFWWLIWTTVSAEWECNWIKLNTNFPVVWNCISFSDWEEGTNPKNVFPKMIWGLTKVIMSLVLVWCFIWVIVAWIMRAADNPWTRKSWWAKWLLARIAITMLLLWFSGVILRLINPNFFG